MTASAEKIAEAVIKGLIYDVALKAVLARLVVMAPFLGWPVINAVFVFIMTKLAGMLYEEMSLVASFALIDFKTEAERHAYEEAVGGLRQAIQEDKSSEEIQRQKTEAKKRLGEFIRLRPSPAR